MTYACVKLVLHLKMAEKNHHKHSEGEKKNYNLMLNIINSPGNN